MRQSDSEKIQLSGQLGEAQAGQRLDQAAGAALRLDPDCARSYAARTGRGNHDSGQPNHAAGTDPLPGPHPGPLPALPLGR